MPVTKPESFAMTKEYEAPDCIFCHLIPGHNREVLDANESFIAVFDHFPVNRGHILLVSKRHITSPFELTRQEGADLVDSLSSVKILLQKRFQPDGYNIGINTGQAAGQTIPHLHIHVIPRYQGDVKEPRGGIRNLKHPLSPY